MTSRKKLYAPLAKRRDGKALLLAFVSRVAVVGEVKPEDISESTLNHYECARAPVRCRQCGDTGFIGCGIAPPLTGLDCNDCDVVSKRMAAYQHVRDLEDRVHALERIVSDRAIEEQQ